MEFFILIIAFLSHGFRLIHGELIEVNARSLENAYVVSVLSSEDGKVIQKGDSADLANHFRSLPNDIRTILEAHASSDTELASCIGNHKIFADDYLVEKYLGNGKQLYRLVNPDQMDIRLGHVDQRVDVLLRRSKMLVVFYDHREDRAFKMIPYSNGYLFFRLEEGLNTLEGRIVAFADTKNRNIYYATKIRDIAGTSPIRLIEMWNRYIEGKVIDDGRYNADDVNYVKSRNEYYGYIFNQIKTYMSREKNIGGNFPIGPKSTPAKDQKNSIKSWIPFHRVLTNSPKITEVNPESIEYAFLATVMSAKDERNFEQNIVKYDEKTFKQESKKLLNVLLKHTDQGIRELGRYRGDRRIFGEYHRLRDERKTLFNINQAEDVVPRRCSCLVLDHIHQKALKVQFTMMIVFLHEYKVALKAIPYANGYLLFRIHSDEWETSNDYKYCAYIVAFANTEDGNIYQIEKTKRLIAVTPQELNEEWKKYANQKTSSNRTGKGDSYLKNIFAQVENLFPGDQTPKKSKENVPEFPLHILKKSGTQSTNSAPVKDLGPQKDPKSKRGASCFHPGSTSKS